MSNPSSSEEPVAVDPNAGLKNLEKKLQDAYLWEMFKREHNHRIMNTTGYQGIIYTNLSIQRENVKRIRLFLLKGFETKGWKNYVPATK